MDSQDRYLEDAIAVVQEQAFYMKRAIDNDNMRETLKYAANLISELRTSLLLPKNYHDLYMQVFQEMQYLATFFSDKARHKRKMTELYGSVQNAGGILPRLYLLATVGGSYIKSREVPAKEVLTDLSELCKGVQDPMRGLFLRYFLSQMVKDKLPDTGSDYEKEGGGDIGDAFSFMLANLVESNRFWVRMQHEAPLNDRCRHEEQRNDLRVLVGANLVRLSQLDGMTVKFYSEVALPHILEHVLVVKEATSQQYLFETIIQVFPVAYHIETLEYLVTGISKAMPAADLRSILMALIKCFVPSLHSDETVLPGGVSKTNFLTFFCQCMQTAFQHRLDSSTFDFTICLDVQVELLALARTQSDHLLHVNNALSSIVSILQKYFFVRGDESGNGVKRLDPTTSEYIIGFIDAALQPLSLDVLELEQYPALLSLLSFHARKKVALSIIRCVVSNNVALDRTEIVTKIFAVITPLVKDEDDTPGNHENSGDEYSDEQQEVCRLMYQIRVADLGAECDILDAIRSYFCQGGASRMVHTLPPTICASIELMGKLGARDKDYRKSAGDESSSGTCVGVKKACQLVHKSVTALATCAPDTALQLWLRAAVTVDRLHKDSSESLEASCYEFMSQGMICFEERITESRRQYDGIFQLVGTLSILTCLEVENRDTISGKIISYAARLLMKPLQCKAISVCAHMFWNDGCREGHKVLECLQKCLKICGGVVQQDAKHVGLWVEMLDVYIFYFEKDCEEVTIKFIESLVNLCLEHISFASTTDDCVEESEKASKHLKDSIRYLTLVKRDGSVQVPRFAGFGDEDLLKRVAAL